MNTKPTPQQLMESVLTVVASDMVEAARKDLQPIVAAATFVAELEALPQYVWEEHVTIRNIHDLRHMLHAHKVQEQRLTAEMAAESEYLSWYYR